MTLAPPFGQQDFAAGIVRVAPHLIPPNGAWKLQNYLLDEDGSAYKRGGTAAKSTVFDADGLTFLWDGYLAAGRRTLFASATDFGVLAADDATPITLGGGGLVKPLRPVVLNGLLYVGDRAYGGSRLTAASTAGTLAVTNGSATVTGSGTSWLTTVDAGMVLVVGGRLVAVKSVTSDMQLELYVPWPGATASGLAYVATPIAQMPAGYHPSGIYAVAGNRLISCVDDVAHMTEIFDATTWPADENHRVPDGVRIIGAAGIEDRLFLFTTAGVWMVGNLVYDLTDQFGDVQQRLEQLNGDMVLWDAAGIATWRNALVVPAIDGVWLLGRDGSTELLSRAITPLYTEYVRGSYRLGGAAISEGHYLLPVLDGSSKVVDQLVCRIDRPVDVERFGRVFPWTTWAGAGGKLPALAQRVGDAVRAPELLGASQDGRVVKVAPFEPDGPRLDHDGTAPVADMVLRDVATGPLNENLVKKVRARYELRDADGSPTIQASYGTDKRPAAAVWGTGVWGSMLWTDREETGFTPLEGAAPESDGDEPYPWRVNKRVRFLRLRLRCADPCTRLVVRAVDLVVRPSGRI